MIIKVLAITAVGKPWSCILNTFLHGVAKRVHTKPKPAYMPSFYLKNI